MQHSIVYFPDYAHANPYQTLLYSGIDGSGWREGSDEKVNDFAVKFRYLLGAGAQIYGKLSYYDVKSMTPGGLTVAQTIAKFNKVVRINEASRELAKVQETQATQQVQSGALAPAPLAAT